MSTHARLILIKLPTGKEETTKLPQSNPEARRLVQTYSRIRTYLHHHGSRARRLPTRRRGAHSSRPNLPLLVLVLVLLRAATSPRQLASSQRHGPMATKNPRPTAELRSHLNQSPAVLLVRPQHAARASRVAVVRLRSARREKIRGGRRPDPVNELGRAGVGEPSTRAQRKASDQQSEQ